MISDEDNRARSENRRLVQVAAPLPIKHCFSCDRWLAAAVDQRAGIRGACSPGGASPGAKGSSGVSRDGYHRWLGASRSFDGDGRALRPGARDRDDLCQRQHRRVRAGEHPHQGRICTDQAGAHGEVIDGRVAFQTGTEDEFTAAIDRLRHRRVGAFLSTNRSTSGVACELLFLDAAPISAQNGTDP